jgi:phage gp36-like protein
MAYCTIDQVQALIPVALWDHTATTPEPSVTDVTAWSLEADAEIDSKIGGRYQTPITGTEALKVVSSIAAAIIAERIWGVIFTGQTGAPDVPQHIKDMRKLLEAVAAGNAELKDAASLGVTGPMDLGSPAMTMRELREDPLQSEPMDPVFSLGDRF